MKYFKVILIGHGSSMNYAKDNFEILTRMIAKDNPNYDVDYCFMTDGIEILNKKIYSNLSPDIKKIIVVPVFLSHGVHTKKDIPNMLELDNDNEKNIRHQGRTIKLIYCEPLGINQQIADIVLDRIQAAIDF